jgi:hypothetical protein
MPIRHCQTLKENMYKIRKDCVLKFGKISFKVREIFYFEKRDKHNILASSRTRYDYNHSGSYSNLAALAKESHALGDQTNFHNSLNLNNTIVRNTSYVNNPALDIKKKYKFVKNKRNLA